MAPETVISPISGLWALLLFLLHGHFTLSYRALAAPRAGFVRCLSPQKDAERWLQCEPGLLELAVPWLEVGLTRDEA